MKKTKLFALAFAALALGACSNDDIVDQQGGGAQWNAEGQGYINLAINLPTQPTSRANDQYDDGTVEEYDVKDATLILFADGKVNSAYAMNLNFSAPDATVDNITTTAKITQQIKSVESTNLEALVVLNNNGMFTVNNGDLLVGNASMVGKSLDELNDAVNAQIGNKTWTETGFLMSNAVLATAQGGAVDPATATTKTLVPIDASKIEETPTAASLNPAANIYVERAVSKVTLIASDGETTDGTKMAYTIDGWVLDQTNKSSKLVRTAAQFNTWKSYFSNAATLTDKYRFVGSIPVGQNIDGNETYYRVYWGEDYNYGNPADNSFATVGDTPADAVLNTNVDGTVASYCFENTSDLANMLEDNMTRVIVKATFNGGKDFYIVGEDKNTIWTLAQVQQEVAARLINEPSFNAWAKANLLDQNTWLTEEDFNVTLSTEAGECTVTDITLTEAGKAKLKADADFTKANAVALANGEIKLDKYANGESYYYVYVSHFGEDGTPWDDNETTTPSADNIYPGGETNYLGRWGMLRNNWYEINVTSIKGIGDPTVAKVNGTIDKKDSYISVDINILSWAKRVQDAEL